jgi:hypothetical protein
MYKTQWESITPEQESHHSIFRERKHAIGTTCVRYRSRSEGICACNSPLRCSPAPCRTLADKDVVRTDRTTAFFQDLEGPNLRQLNDILVTYTFFNFDLGAGNTSAPPYLCLFF